MRRVVYLGITLGLTIAMFCGLTSLPACYDVPQPACGFRCGPAGECPADYTCSTLEPRCHLAGTDPAMRCDTVDDGGDAAIDSPVDAVDAAVDADAPDDAPNDADAPTDGPDDAPDAPPDADPDAPADA